MKKILLVTLLFLEGASLAETIKQPCGLQGSVDERIKDCSLQLNSKKESFLLVTRSKNFKEIWKELNTGILWSDRLSSNMGYQSAKRLCKEGAIEMEDFSNLEWKLPSVDEYLDAYNKGINRLLPNMNYLFWTSTENPPLPQNSRVGSKNSYYESMTINGCYQNNPSDKCHFQETKNDVSVRCIATENKI